ncbi:glycine betaine ABC transporter substrate-binding protein [Tropicimonas sp. TH_r6]|uniref:ABC transporter substrate-binding protein n=1 Tax=Tropicimonas sp. TH_r6 TaxID=3082085 RepID=UPI00295457B7|nr:glycine betaine ABC transporter substrate-binding protein [Tropicimonas sp. TH_r6]MDV7144599.1 glycine betaine ABC transporter substrate-binding protein [Tropicimonas sp. TH_r6]
MVSAEAVPKILQTMLLAGALAVPSTVTDARERVMVGEPSWLGARIMANLIGQIVVEELDQPVGYAPRANAGIFAGMDQGKGGMDIHPDVWLPNQRFFVELYVGQKGSVALSRGSYEGRSGFCVPTVFAQEHDIRTLQDLAAPRLRGELDADGNGLNEIWIGAEGWASTYIHKVKMRDYGLSESLEYTSDPEPDFLARLDARLAEGEGAAFHCYTPHYQQISHALTMLEEPAHDPDLYHVVTPDEDNDWFEKSRVASGDPVKSVHVAYSLRLEAEFPRVAAFLSRIDMDAEDVARLSYAVQIDGVPIPAAVRTWIEANPERIAAWLAP